MTATPELTAELRKLVLEVEDDLRERLTEDSERRGQWKNEHDAALKAERTSASWEAWRDDRITQSAVAWVLTTVFVRFCEDNGLVSGVWITGPGAKAQEALDAELEYFRQNPEHTYREWALQAVQHLRSLPATSGLVEGHSPLWQVQPSGKMAQTVLDFWRETGADGKLLRDLSDQELSTRFLGDLYQDLSDYAKKTYALLQTPEFVEEFILDQTLTPALKERPLEGFKIIDPTCGSGHFLLGAFHRMLSAWADHAPGLETRVRVQNALDSINGVDLNPFAVAISKFRLTVAALKAEGSTSLESAPAFKFHLAAGDTLLHGQAQREFAFDGFDADSKLSGFVYATEDLDLLKKLLKPGQYDVVVGNPPYITVKDKTLNAAYRGIYKTCKGTYALTVPFMERFFGLAKRGTDNQRAGWTGQITSNSFMKREFGSKLIEDFLSRQDLRLVADTSGAYIPGHGTPTVIIVGRHQPPVGSTVRAVLGVRGEPGRPDNPEKGLVWRSIIDNVGHSDFNDQWITVTDLSRSTLATHPWSLTGGMAQAVVDEMEKSRRKLREFIRPPIGGAIRAGYDDAFIRANSERRTASIPKTMWKTLVTGDSVRDWSFAPQNSIIFPYDSESLQPLDCAVSRDLWAWRTVLAQRATFQGVMADAGLQWWEYMQFTRNTYLSRYSITFAQISSHNHFYIDEGGSVFKETAPVIKLPVDASLERHIDLLGILNSSAACFWLKAKNYPKGGDPIGGDGARLSQEPWSDRYQLSGSSMTELPIPQHFARNRTATIRDLANKLANASPQNLISAQHITRETLMAGKNMSMSVLGQMIAEQEELDWETYRLYGLVNEDVTFDGRTPELRLGERAFEIALACKIANSEAVTTWFKRHGSTPITEIPTHWSEDYRALVQRRLDLIESDPKIRLLEKPEYKRRWASESWEKQQERALRGWLLDRLEDRKYWFDSYGRPAPCSIAQLADLVARDSDFVSVLELWSETKDVDVVKALTSLLTDEAVPYLAAQRLKPAGLEKRKGWERTWDLQRKEDAGEDVGAIAVPPKYAPADFRKASYWQARGKLDVPKERFILYPDAGRSTDPTLLLGWAGWDHAEQFLALAAIEDQRIDEGGETEKLLPLVAGMDELLPWVRQWHQDIDPAYGTSMALFCTEQLEQRRAALGVTTHQLKAWRPPTSTRGRRATIKETA